MAGLSGNLLFMQVLGINILRSVFAKVVNKVIAVEAPAVGAVCFVRCEQHRNQHGKLQEGRKRGKGRGRVRESVCVCVSEEGECVLLVALRKVPGRIQHTDRHTHTHTHDQEAGQPDCRWCHLTMTQIAAMPMMVARRFLAR